MKKWKLLNYLVIGTLFFPLLGLAQVSQEVIEQNRTILGGKTNPPYGENFNHQVAVESFGDSSGSPNYAGVNVLVDKKTGAIVVVGNSQKLPKEVTGNPNNVNVTLRVRYDNFEVDGVRGADQLSLPARRNLEAAVSQRNGDVNFFRTESQRDIREDEMRTTEKKFQESLERQITGYNLDLKQANTIITNLQNLAKKFPDDKSIQETLSRYLVEREKIVKSKQSAEQELRMSQRRTAKGLTRRPPKAPAAVTQAQPAQHQSFRWWKFWGRPSGKAGSFAMFFLPDVLRRINPSFDPDYRARQAYLQEKEKLEEQKQLLENQLNYRLPPGALGLIQKQLDEVKGDLQALEIKELARQGIFIRKDVLENNNSKDEDKNSP